MTPAAIGKLTIWQIAKLYGPDEKQKPKGPGISVYELYARVKKREGWDPEQIRAGWDKKMSEKKFANGRRPRKRP